MDSRKDYIEKCSDPSKRNLDRNRGFQAEGFANALEQVAKNSLPAKAVENDANSALNAYILEGIRVCCEGNSLDHSSENFGQSFGV